MAEQKASAPAEKKEAKPDAAQPTPPKGGATVVSNTQLTEEEANEIREKSLEEKAEEGKVWHPLSGTGGGVHGQAVVIHNPDVDAPVVVVKGQDVRFESEGYKLHETPDPGADK